MEVATPDGMRADAQRPCPAVPKPLPSSDLSLVNRIIDLATQFVTWTLPVPSKHCEDAASSEVLPLRTYIQELLRRSRARYSTLSLALHYLVLLKTHLKRHPDIVTQSALRCRRRMFLAALVLAWKYLYDYNYPASVWSRISGLQIREINTNEMAFLTSIDWKLHITSPDWDRWQEIVPRSSTSSLGTCDQDA